MILKPFHGKWSEKRNPNLWIILQVSLISVDIVPKEQFIWVKILRQIILMSGIWIDETIVSLPSNKVILSHNLSDLFSAVLLFLSLICTVFSLFYFYFLIWNRKILLSKKKSKGMLANPRNTEPRGIKRYDASEKGNKAWSIFQLGKKKEKTPTHTNYSSIWIAKYLLFYPWP